MRFFGISIDSLLPWRMASRIRMLAFVLDKIGKGNFSQKAPISEGDIIGKLGVKINEIATSLESQIGKLKHERVQLKTIISNMSEGVVVTNEDGIIILANPSWYKIFGSSPKSLGQPILESVRIPHIFDTIMNALKSKKLSEEEFGVGDRFFVARAVPFETNQVKGCVTVINDITKVKRLERMRRDFTANVSHQMKTPLTSILGYSETLLNGALKDESSTYKFVETIHEQSLQLKELIDDVLELARIESVAKDVEAADMDIGELVEALINEFSDNKKGIIVNYTLAKIVVKSERTAVEHILRNLLDNAIKYTPVGGTVSVLLEELDRNVSVSIEDTGIGINAGELDRVFERFYRVDQSIKGSGLGLAIAKHLTDKIGGQILVQSKLGKGSKFQLILPKMS